MTDCDLLLRGGTIYDGSGDPPRRADLALAGERILALTAPDDAVNAARVLDVDGLAVAPGFINMLSWSNESLIEDGRSQSEIRQGVTLEVMGEGESMGPLSPAMKESGPGSYMSQGDILYDVEWATLGEYLEWLEARGVACNVASFVGSSTLRIHAMGRDNRAPTDAELEEMKDLLREALREGAMGMSAALIYAPACFAETDELIELARVVADHDAMFISHIRNEGGDLLEAVEELVTIARETGVTAEIYHLKASGAANWHRMEGAIAAVEAARAEGLPVTADMYSYTYSGTGLDTCIPPWAHEGGITALIARLRDPDIRARLVAEMTQPGGDWENRALMLPPQNILLAGLRKPEMQHLQGVTLAEIMQQRGSDSAAETLIDLIIEDDSRIFTMYFAMDEDNLRRQVQLPWVSFCSDAESQAPEGVFLNNIPHPRAYGSFARVLGKYVRDEGLLTLQEAVRKLSGFPAQNLKLRGRGLLRPGYFADVVVFDPVQVQDHATPQDPHRYATGMQQVFVNGRQVLRDGEHTDALPGQVLRGPGWTGWR
ncbi:MAG: D-aminoacylase [Anaerolineaceae bacterium]|nr:D-aminoacylase [Anaerolineaceae bacterium]